MIHKEQTKDPRTGETITKYTTDLKGHKVVIDSNGSPTEVRMDIDERRNRRDGQSKGKFKQKGVSKLQKKLERERDERMGKVKKKDILDRLGEYVDTVLESDVTNKLNTNSSNSVLEGINLYLEKEDKKEDDEEEKEYDDLSDEDKKKVDNAVNKLKGVAKQYIGGEGDDEEDDSDDDSDSEEEIEEPEDDDTNDEEGGEEDQDSGDDEEQEVDDTEDSPEDDDTNDEEGGEEDQDSGDEPEDDGELVDPKDDEDDGEEEPEDDGTPDVDLGDDPENTDGNMNDTGEEEPEDEIDGNNEVAEYTKESEYDLDTNNSYDFYDFLIGKFYDDGIISKINGAYSDIPVEKRKLVPARELLKAINSTFDANKDSGMGGGLDGGMGGGMPQMPQGGEF